VALRHVDETGFDPCGVGVLADSWRPQSGTPAYCTELGLEDWRRPWLRPTGPRPRAHLTA
jgi:hypothetical protein